MQWSSVNVYPIWDDSYKNYNFVKQPISQDEINLWRSQGYDHKSFSGVMYGGKNVMPNWIHKVSDILDLKNCGHVIYRMDTNDIMPTHSDHYNTYCKVFDVEYNDVYRAIVFLEDWKPGHYFEIDNTGCTNWKAGDYYLWKGDVVHAASNIGIDPRYTLQITGTIL